MKLYRALVAAVLAASLTLSAGAAFTPSVEYKDAPQVVEKIDAEGNVTVGEVRNADGEVVESVPADAIKVTAISETKKDSAGVEPEVAEALKAVEAELTVAFEMAKTEENELIKAVSEDLNNAPVENIVVTDVVAITVTPEIEEALAEEGATLTVSVTSQNISKEDEEKITVYQKDPATGEWKKVPFTIDENDVITLELESTGEVVIFRDSEAAPETPKDAPRSPKTRPTTANRFNRFVKPKNRH